MNQKEYTLSRKDKKFLSALMLLQLSFIMMTVSFFGLYYKSEINECKRVAKRIELADWATEEVEKAQTEKKLESIKRGYINQGISAEEF